jgi:hypothetical protein
VASRVDDLIAQGAVQVSRKYRRLFVAPKDCVQYLRDNDPKTYDSLVEETLKRFQSEALAILWSRQQDTHTVELSVKEFEEFYQKMNGKPPWSAEGKEHCPDCSSLGHMHRRDCPRVKP